MMMMIITIAKDQEFLWEGVESFLNGQLHAVQCKAVVDK